MTTIRSTAVTRPQRGAILVVVAVLMVVLISFLALAVDFSRIYVQKNELHTAVDAAAHAGVIQIYSDPSKVGDTAIFYGRRNTVLKKILPNAVFTVTCGNWDDDATPESSRFTASGGCDLTNNAVRVHVFDSTTYLFPSLLNFVSKQLNITSIAWMAFVGPTSCIKPWGIDYRVLTTRLDSLGDPLRDLTDDDIYKLNTLPVADLTFNLKYGDATTPGNYGPIRVDEGASGASDYRDTITGCSTRIIGPDSVVGLETGNMKGPTFDAVSQLCDQLTPSKLNPQDPVGACYYTAPDGTTKFGYPVRAVLWLSDQIPNGSTDVTIKIVASFSLDSLTKDSNIIGHWVPFTGRGVITETPSTVRAPVLVK